MNEQEITHNTRRHSGTATMLSLISPGLGQIYCGRLIRGLVFAFLSGLGFQFMFMLPLVGPQTYPIALCVILLLLGAFVTVCSAVDAWLLAGKTHVDYILKEYNCWLFYVLWCLCALGWAIGIAGVVRQNIMEVFVVPSSSMEPQVVPGSRILVDKRIYQRSDPLAGDVVVFLNPDNRRQSYVSRVIAVAGDTIAVKGGFAWINGKRLADDGVVDTPSDPNQPAQPQEVMEKIGSTAFTVILGGDSMPAPADFPETIVPKNQVFVLSDNRDKARDSRRLGPIPIVSISGRVIFTIGWSRVGTIE